LIIFYRSSRILYPANDIADVYHHMAEKVNCLFSFIIVS